MIGRCLGIDFIELDDRPEESLVLCAFSLKAQRCHLAAALRNFLHRNSPFSAIIEFLQALGFSLFIEWMMIWHTACSSDTPLQAKLFDCF